MIEFQVKSKKATLGKNKGQTIYFAQRLAHPRKSLSDIERSIAFATTLTRADVRACIVALTDIVEGYLQDGFAVDLGELGMLSLMISSRQLLKEEDVSAQTLRAPRVRYFPKSKIRQAARAASLSVDNPKAKGTKTPKTPKVPSQPGGGGVGI